MASDRLRLATELVYDEPDAAYGLCREELRDNPDSHAAWTLAGVIACRAERLPEALAFFERALKINPARAEGWSNLGTALHELRRPAEARVAFRRAYELREDALYVCNIGVTYSDEGNHVEALKWIRKAERMQPDLPNIPAAACFAELATGDWVNGWKHWDTLLGTSKYRKRLDFGAPDWDGSPVDTLVIYGEQGLGDEISYASCFEDVRPLAKKVKIECDPRLESLYRRSFPWAEVHGTRREAQDWDTSCDAQVACGSLPRLFRSQPESCPRMPYLVPDPERRLMWRALFDSWQKPVVGLAWSGGRFNTGASRRDVGLESFRPLIDGRDAVFVSLQYKDPTEDIEATGLPVRQFDLSATNYDDTVALVAELDELIGVHTTMHHAAGAVGKASRVLVPSVPQWAYCYGDRLPWYASQVYHRQRKDEKWQDCIRRM